MLDTGRPPFVQGELYASLQILLELNGVPEFAAKVEVTGDLGDPGLDNFRTRKTNVLGSLDGTEELIQPKDNNGLPTADVGMIFTADPIVGQVDLLQPRFIGNVLEAKYSFTIETFGGGNESWASVSFADPFSGTPASFDFQARGAGSTLPEPGTLGIAALAIVLVAARSARAEKRGSERAVL